MNGLIRACEKRPVSFSTMEEIVNEIEQTLQNEMEREVSSAEMCIRDRGELVFTSITKKAFPLLRYRTRDICTLTREKCPCGRTHVKMSKPRGRCV